MTTSYTNATLDSGQWRDLYALYPSLANRDVVVRYISPFSARIFHGGATAPASLTDGDPMNPSEAVYANSDRLWVTGQGVVSITQL